MGFPPQLFMTEKGPIDGTTLRMLKMLEQRLNFRTAIIVRKSFDDAFNKVCNLHLWNKIARAPKDQTIKSSIVPVCSSMCVSEQ